MYRSPIIDTKVLNMFSGRLITRLCIDRLVSSRSLFVQRLLRNNVVTTAEPADVSDVGDQGRELYGSIVNKLKEDGHRVILDDSFFERSIVPLLVNKGADKKLIFNALTSTTSLFCTDTSDFTNYFQLLEGIGLTVNDCLVIAAKNPQMIRASFGLQPRILDLVNSGLRMNIVRQILRKFPEVLNVEAQKIAHLIAVIRSFFTPKQFNYMVDRYPQILLLNCDQLEQKYEYIYYMMGLDNTHVAKTKWFQHSLFHIQTRHECLLRAGVFVKPDPKRPFLSSQNPKLGDILDSDDVTFAKEVCGITLAEYDTFQRMYERQCARDVAGSVEYYAEGEEPDQLHNDEER